MTQITEYSTGTVGVCAFYCHRWDCLHCGTQRKAEIKNMVMARSKIWYGKIITEDELDAVKKRVSVADDKYVAIGTGNNILVMTLNSVLPDSHAIGLTKLKELIDMHLDVQYDFRTRRFRHSNDLFAKKAKPVTEAHIMAQYASRETPKAVVERFRSEGYEDSFSGRGYYLRRAGAKRTVNEVLIASEKCLAWRE